MRLLRVVNPSGDFLFASSDVRLDVVHRQNPKPVVDVKGFYAYLGLDPNCSEDELRSRARTLWRKTHPDTGGDVEQFLELQKVLQVLLDRNSREAYNALDAMDLYLSPLEIEGRVASARINGDVREVKEILHAQGIEIVSNLQQETPLSYFIEEGSIQDEKSLSRLTHYTELLVETAIDLGFIGTLRTGIALSGTYPVEIRYGQPIYLIGDVKPSKKGAESALRGTILKLSN